MQKPQRGPRYPLVGLARKKNQSWNTFQIRLVGVGRRWYQRSDSTGGFIGRWGGKWRREHGFYWHTWIKRCDLNISGTLSSLRFPIVAPSNARARADVAWHNHSEGLPATIAPPAPKCMNTMQLTTELVDASAAERSGRNLWSWTKVQNVGHPWVAPFYCHNASLGMRYVWSLHFAHWRSIKGANSRNTT